MTSPLPLALACFSILLVRGAGTMRLATHMLDETRRDDVSPLSLDPEGAWRRVDVGHIRNEDETRIHKTC